MRSFIFLSALLGCILPSCLNAQYNHFEKITEEQGLSDNRVTCFKKDRTGFLWVGTENGLNRYDGFSFRIYRPGESSFRLSHERINDIEEDAHGRLWVSTMNGLNVLDPETDSLTVFIPGDEASRQPLNAVSSALIWDTHIDVAGRVWIAPDSRDLCYYDPLKRTFHHLPWRDFVKTLLPSRGERYTAIQKIDQKSKDEVWLGTTLGLFSCNTVEGTFQYHGGEDPVDCVSLLYDSLRQVVYFGQHNSYAYDARKKTLEKIKGDETMPFIKETRDAIMVPSLSGLWAVNPGQKKASLLSAGEPTHFSLHHPKVNSVYHENGTVWIGTTDGIRMYDHRLDRFAFIPLFPDTIHSAGGNAFHILDHARDQRYYVSSMAQHKLIVVDKKTAKQKALSHIDGKPLMQCSKTYEDSQHRLWVLTRFHIFVSDSKHERFQVFTVPPDDDYAFMDMAEDADGNFWFASLRHGVFKYDPKQETWRVLQEDPDGLFAIRPTALLSDTASRAVWVGDYSFGVFRYDLDEAKCTYFDMDAHRPGHLRSSLVNDLTLDKNGSVWVATTSGGVSKYSKQTNDFTTFTMQDGLPENSITAIEADRFGNLWMSSFKGLTCMAPTGRVIKHYDKHNGLPFTGFNAPLSVNNDGEILTGIANGFLKFHPDSLTVTTVDFPVVITAIRQANRMLSKHYWLPFNHDENEFSFDFSALTYTLPRQVNYLYRLAGYDNDWNSAGNVATAKYTNLPEGAYTFLVKATDYSGRESMNTASFKFIIQPPFWKRWWFIVLVATALVLSLGLWIRYLLRQIRSQAILNQFATSLYNQHTIRDVFWTVAKNCVDLLNFEDCVLYLVQEENDVLVQKAAAGPKSTEPFQIHNPIEIPIGKGIVGSVAQTGKPEIIYNTARDRRYIIDDQRRLSELAVPIWVDGRVFGVIDTEHRRKNFYNRWHLQMLEKVAAICSVKISRYFVEEQIRSKVARDLHDEMGSTLSSIRIMSNIALQKKEAAISETYLTSIQQNASQMQESMSDIVWAINPENDSMESIVVRMKEFCAEILEPLEIEYDFTEEGNFQEARLDLNARKDFYLIFKEALNNAAKYSACKKVSIHLKHGERFNELRLQDDGKGFQTGTEQQGNGLKNMRYRAKNILAELSIQSAPGEGTEITLRIPSHHHGM